MDFESALADEILPLDKPAKRWLKRAFDVVGSASLIVLLSPVLLVLYLLIRKTGPNAIFSHERVGEGGKTFGCLKFRSMVVNAQEVLEELLKNNAEARIEWEKDFKLKNDPRITQLGAFIRRTSLDELPQLFNVLKGEMSLVGPRPVVKREIERYGASAYYYYAVKPGMTGLWQVNGRNDTKYEHRVMLDREYVKEWSVMFDIVILIKTIKVVLISKGAY